MAIILGTGALSLRGRRRLGEAAAGAGVQRRRRRGRRRRAGPRLRVQPRRAPDGACSTATATSCAPGARACSTRAHGVHMAPDDTLWLTDDGDHTVRHCTLDGKVLLTIGIPGKPAPYMSGEPFHRCTHTALSPQGDLYVSDGYGNARVHKYAPDGKLLLSWGEPGTDPGQFNIAAQHLLRRRRLGLRRRPREPPRPGVRRQRQVRDAVEQHAPPLGPLHGARRAGRASTSARSAAALARQLRHAQHRAARQHLQPQGRAAGAARRTARPGSSPASSSRRTGSPSTRAATSTSARCRSPTGAIATRASRIPPGLRSLQKLVKVA